MCPERRVSAKSGVAEFALEGFVVRVNGLVPRQRRRGVEASEADLADESPVPFVSFDVGQDERVRVKLLVAFHALVHRAALLVVQLDSRNSGGRKGRMRIRR